MQDRAREEMTHQEILGTSWNEDGLLQDLHDLEAFLRSAPRKLRPVAARWRDRTLRVVTILQSVGRLHVPDHNGR